MSGMDRVRVVRGSVTCSPLVSSVVDPGPPASARPDMAVWSRVTMVANGPYTLCWCGAVKDEVKLHSKRVEKM